MTIRKITPSDRSEYFNMAREFYSSDAVMHDVGEENISAAFEEYLRSDVYAECFILEDGGIAVGYGQISKTFSQEAGGLVIWLEELFIKKNFRGKGYGKAYFDFIFKNYPAKRYRLEVEKENEGAVRLYKSLGFGFFAYDQMIKGE